MSKQIRLHKCFGPHIILFDCLTLSVTILTKSYRVCFCNKSERFTIRNGKVVDDLNYQSSISRKLLELRVIIASKVF